MEPGGRIDGLTPTQRISTVRKALRWNTGQNDLRQQCIDVVEEIISNPMSADFTKLKAVDIVVKMEAQNLVDERMVDTEGAGDGPQLVLVLPRNDSEVGGEE